MQIGVVGSRNFKDYTLMKNALSKYTITKIISGGALGADSLAEDYAKENNIPLLVLHAEWDNLAARPCKIKYKNGKPYNALAGFNRNEEIVQNADVIIAFWDGTSPGTKNTIEYAQSLNKPVIIHRFGEK